MTAVPLAPAHRPGPPNAPTSRPTSHNVKVQGKDNGAARSTPGPGGTPTARFPPDPPLPQPERRSAPRPQVQPARKGALRALTGNNRATLPAPATRRPANPRGAQPAPWASPTRPGLPDSHRTPSRTPEVPAQPVHAPNPPPYRSNQPRPAARTAIEDQADRGLRPPPPGPPRSAEAPRGGLEKTRVQGLRPGPASTPGTDRTGTVNDNAGQPPMSRAGTRPGRGSGHPDSDRTPATHPPHTGTPTHPGSQPPAVPGQTPPGLRPGGWLHSVPVPLTSPPQQDRGARSGTPPLHSTSRKSRFKSKP
jgi:hypothetical protein